MADRTDYPLKYAAALEGDARPHPDFRPDGIAPRLGHALGKLAADPAATSEVRGLSRAALVSGDTGILPILADALDESGHEAKDQFDWRHAPRGIAIDKALEAEIGRHRIRQTVIHAATPMESRRELTPLSPGWVLADWKEKTRGRVSQKRALEEVRRYVPDANKTDMHHSILRLTTLHNNVRPAYRQAAVGVGPLGRRVSPEETAVNEYALESALSGPSENARSVDNANLMQLGSKPFSHGDYPASVHSYPDTRTK